MDRKSVEVAVIGGGQAGLALSYHLRALGRDHLILEQARMVESWRSRRWDSLRLIAPNWSLLMPGFTYHGPEPDSFMTKDEVVQHLEGYARTINAPVEEGVRVDHVEGDGMGGAFRLRTSSGELQAGSVVLATGALQRPRVPDYSAEIPTGVTQLIAGDYRKPAAVAAGKVLIVGSGETGVQIAEELANAGRDVYLSGGRSWWAPRRYRGRDITAWLRLLGYFDRLVGDLPRGQRTGKPNPQLTGADGGHDINPHLLRRSGVTLLGRLKGIEGGRAFFVDDLAANVAWGDAQARDLLASIDRLAADQELQAPVEDWPADLADSSTRSPASIWTTPAELDLVADGVSTVIWATGYRPDFGWVDLPFLDADGHPVQRRGVTQVPGLYVLGLDWLHTARSGLFAGVGDDASYVASAIVATGA